MMKKTETGMGGVVVIDDSIIARGITHYGAEKQKVVCMEECAELIRAVSKTIRAGVDDISRAQLVEEMADVTICLAMLQQIYGIADADLADWVRDKQRLFRMKMDQELKNPGEGIR